MKNNSCDYNLFNTTQTDICLGLFDRFQYDVKDINVYNILGTCYGLPDDPAELKGMTMINGEKKHYKRGFTAAEYTPWVKTRNPNFSGYKDDNGLPPCVYGIPVTDYLNSPDVRRVLNIPDSVPGWSMCNDIDYDILPEGSQWVYERLADATKTTAKYRILKFTGDIDGSVPTTGTLGWIGALNWPVKTPWSMYKLDDQTTVAGYFEVYDISDSFTVATVHKAGHMVPQFQPEKAYDLIFKWLKNELKPWVPPTPSQN